MPYVESMIETLETFRDRKMWKEGFMVWDDSRETRIGICNSAIDTIRELQAEVEQLKKEKDEAYHKGFLDGQSNILEAQAE